MVERLDADASPEKRLFVSLITRDIPLVAAFLDLIDNSVNAAIEPYSDRLRSAPDYLSALQDDTIVPAVSISLDITETKVTITDDATGISAKTAQEHVFKFGRAEGEAHEHDRLSVYGIGLKRAMFKLGNEITIRSDHSDGGFDLKLNVAAWLKVNKGPWVFPITVRPAAPPKTGTSIAVQGLYDDVRRRISDGVFIGQLKDAIARTYPRWVEIENVVVVFGEPENGLVPTRKALLTVQAVAKGPDNPIAKLKAVILKNPVENDVQGKNFTIVDMIANLPADGSPRVQEAHGLGDRGRLALDIDIERCSLLVFFSNIVRRRGNDEVHASFFQRSHEIKIIRTLNDGLKRSLQRNHIAFS